MEEYTIVIFFIVSLSLYKVDKIQSLVILLKFMEANDRLSKNYNQVNKNQEVEGGEKVDSNVSE